MSDTPKTNAAKFWSDIGGWVTPASKFMELERELNAANERIKRLEHEIELFREHADYEDVCLVEAILKGEEIGRKENQQ
jgi:hypothetical protein